MARQSFTWTALPNGYTADHTGLRLSVLLSPRLDTQDPVASHKKLSEFFPDWEDWPQTLSNARFDVTYNGQTVSIPATTVAGANRVDVHLGLADSSVWKALFTKDLLVKTFKFTDLSPSVMLSYDAAGMADHIEKLYRDLARTATDGLPRVTEIIETEGWRDFIDDVDDLDSRSVSRDTGLRDPRRQFDALRRQGGERAGLSNLARFQLFHTPPATPVTRREKRRDDDRIEAAWVEHKRAELPKREDIAAGLEFHQIVAAIASYPTLLRRLGLVVDLILAPGTFTQSAAADLIVGVAFPPGVLQVPRTTDAHPATRTRLSGTHFDAVPSAAAATPLKDGLLDISPTAFRLLQFDIDGAGLKVINFARSLHRRFDSEARVDPVTRHEDQLGAPALRTGGLMLVHRGRAGTLSKRFNDNKAHNTQLEAQFASGAAPAPVLHAQELVRGYRIDIWDSVTAQWQSLCRRNARYELGDTPVVIDVVPEEESVVRLAATKSSDPGSNADIVYLHEALVSWTGWSLAARPPGRAIKPNDSFEKTGDQTEAETPPGLKFTSRFTTVKGSLPRLRFGRSYWIRARAVDLAGNSLEPQTQDFAAEAPLSNARAYLRYEPVAAPVIALLSQSGALGRPLEGESMARMAIRSFNDTPDDNLRLATQVAHRVAAPPRVSVRDAEQHGKLDRDGLVDATLFNLLAHKKDVDPRDPSAAVRQETLLLQAPLDAAPAETTFAVYEAGRELTYLPDPLAVEVAVRVFDHPNIADSEIIRIPLYPEGDWPDAHPFVVELYEHPNETPYYDATTHRLRVPLPKAIRARLRLSMLLAPEALTLLGVYQMLSPAEQATQRDRALAGQHWMLTPWTVVEAVHAVQRPLLTPEFTVLGVDRPLDKTFARPRIHARCSIDSTDRLDLYGEWHEPLDDPAAADSANGPVDRQRRDTAFQIKITSPKIYADAKAGEVAGGWPEHSLIATDLVGINTLLDKRIPVKAHEFHDTRYRRIEYWLDATTRFREFLPPDLLTTLENGTRVPTEAHIKVTSARQVTWIPNSAPPPAPQVLYVVPIFGWKREIDDHGALSSWRRGGGLRVYLDRGWNASGYGEMLGVVLPPHGFADDPDKTPEGAPYKKYVTQWGNDPVWNSAFVPGIAPTRDDFPLARTGPDPTGAWLPPNAPDAEKDQRPGPFLVRGLYPPGLGQPPAHQIGSLPFGGLQKRGAGSVDVAPHDVFYDPERQLWYCDIEVNAGAAYFPFIRLALARYQPTSSTNAHLSNIVLADIIALTPDRWLNVTPAADARKVRVAVFGVSYRESSAHHEATRAPAMSLMDPLMGRVHVLTPATVAERSIVEVWVERLDARLGEDFGWHKVSDVVISQRIPIPAAVTPASSVSIESVFGRAVSAQELLQTRDLISPRDIARLTPSRVVELIHLWQTLWEGDVAFPEIPPGDARHRLVIAEYEEYLVDDDRPYDKTPTRKDRRLVFVEHVELTVSL